MTKNFFRNFLLPILPWVEILYFFKENNNNKSLLLKKFTLQTINICPETPFLADLFTCKFMLNVIVEELLEQFSQNSSFISGEGKKHTLVFGGDQGINSGKFL